MYGLMSFAEEQPMIITPDELNTIGEQPAHLQLFGYSQVNEAVNLVSAMLPQELRQFAERLDAAQANRLLDALIQAMIVEDAPDLERHQRIGRMMRAIMEETHE
jgi:hypothetical protein